MRQNIQLSKVLAEWWEILLFNLAEKNVSLKGCRPSQPFIYLDHWQPSNHQSPSISLFITYKIRLRIFGYYEGILGHHIS